MMYGARVRFGITYKANQPGFQIYTRKYYHNFKVTTDTKNFEGALGKNLASDNAYVMTDKTNIIINDNQDFSVILQQWQIPNRDKGVEILYQTVSKDEKKIGVAIGKKLIKDEVSITEIAIYKKNAAGKFEIEKLRDWEFTDTCVEFQFDKNDSDALLFFRNDELFKFYYNDETKEIKTIYEYNNPFADTPQYAVFNENQDKFILCSKNDALYINLTKPKGHQEFDIDEQSDISSIQSITSDGESFFVLANKCEKKLGYYLLKINQENPNQSSFLIKW